MLIGLVKVWLGHRTELSYEGYYFLEEAIQCNMDYGIHSYGWLRSGIRNQVPSYSVFIDNMFDL